MPRIRLISIALILFAAPRLHAQQGLEPPPSIVGLWEGAVMVKADSTIVTVRLGQDSDGFAGTIDADDQYALGYALRNVRQDGATAHFELGDNLFPGSFDGDIERGRIYGCFTGVVRGDSVEGAFDLWRRPEGDPQYTTEEIRFESQDLDLAGTVFVPTSPGPHPAIVFLHGSGPQTRDSYIRWFAHRFARDGFVTLIYDKRGTGASGGEPWPRTAGSFADLAEDGLAAVQALAARPDVDASRIGVWGLSQGAWLAPLTARSAEVAFAILLSGGGVTPAEQELYDDEIKLRLRGFSQADVAEALALLRLADQYVRTGVDADWERFEAARSAAQLKPYFGHLDRFPLILPREAPVWEGLRGDLDYDPTPALEALRVPVLLLLGERDDLTPSEETAHRVRTALERAGNEDVTIQIVPGADHGFWMRSNDQTWDRPAPGWVDGMLKWVTERFGTI